MFVVWLPKQYVLVAMLFPTLKQAFWIFYLVSEKLLSCSHLFTCWKKNQNTSPKVGFILIRLVSMSHTLSDKTAIHRCHSEQVSPWPWNTRERTTSALLSMETEQPIRDRYSRRTTSPSCGTFRWYSSVRTTGTAWVRRSNGRPPARTTTRGETTYPASGYVTHIIILISNDQPCLATVWNICSRSWKRHNNTIKQYCKTATFRLEEFCVRAKRSMVFFSSWRPLNYWFEREKF